MLVILAEHKDIIISVLCHLLIKKVTLSINKIDKDKRVIDAFIWSLLLK